ncbi:MAG: tetratricopeptide repeat protein [Chloroflexi bacterium]|nr:tetratricopeptide repeat protein [Chloroflexota bacterium]
MTDALHRGVGNGLILVQSPAGFGKTTLLSDFATEIKDSFNVRWLALDASCYVPEVFAEQLSSMLNGEFDSTPPAAAARTEDLVAYLAVAVKRAAAASDLPLMLVIDNAHELRGADASLELLHVLFSALPDGSEVVLSSRQALNLRQLDKRIVAGECLLLGASELSFTVEEVGELAVRQPREVTAHEVIADTGGWPVGVMAILAGSVAPRGRMRLPAGAAWQRYLTAEVWKTVPPRLQRLLLPLGLPPVITEDVGELLLGRPAWLELCAWLEERDFLFEALPQGAIRLNQLVRQYLLNLYEQQQPEAFAETAEQVALYLEQQGRVPDAIELARVCKARVVLSELLERHGARLIHQGSFALLSRAFDGVGTRASERPLLRAIQARVTAHTGNPHQAMKMASEVYDDATASGKARLHALLAKIRVLRTLGQAEQMLQIFKEIRSVDDCDDPGVAAELTYHEADIELIVTRNFARAERLLRASIEHCQAADAWVLELLSRSTLGQLFVMQGRGPEAVNELVKAAQGWRDVRGTANLGWVLNNLGMAHVLVGDFESAIPVIQEAIREGELCGNLRNLAYANGSLADAELALGHFANAKAAYEESIRLCATAVLDESLAAMCITGLAGAELGLGDLPQAEFLSRRALLIAQAMDNPLELGICALQQAMVDSVSGDHNAAIAGATEAVALFEGIDARTNLQLALYRLALCQFRANRRADAAATLERLSAVLTEAWMIPGLLPGLREHAMFAQWAAARVTAPSFREFVTQTLAPSETDDAEDALPLSPYPRVVARSLGQVEVTVGDRALTGEDWSSQRALELFFLFLSRRQGVRKEEAVELLYPGIPAHKCNSAFHSNLYRVRRALYPESIVHRSGAYLLNSEGEFSWDVDDFEAGISRAASLAGGTVERADAYRGALELYGGPFAEAFFSEWADAVRNRVDVKAMEALSTLAGYHAGRGEYEKAAGCLEQVLERDRYNEEAAYALAGLHVDSGQPLVALKLLDDYRRTYESGLGAPVPERFSTLRARIAAGSRA